MRRQIKTDKEKARKVCASLLILCRDLTKIIDEVSVENGLILRGSVMSALKVCAYMLGREIIDNDLILELAKGDNAKLIDSSEFKEPRIREALESFKESLEYLNKFISHINAVFGFDSTVSSTLTRVRKRFNSRDVRGVLEDMCRAKYC